MSAEEYQGTEMPPSLRTALLDSLLFILAAQFVLTEGAPSQVTGVSLSKELTQQQPQQPTLNVTWNASQSDENVTDYQVKYIRSKDTFGGSLITIKRTKTSELLPALNAGTAYDVRVRARSGSKVGAWSEVQTETTYSRPLKVTGLSVTESVDSGNLNVSWSTPQSDLPITEYEVEYRTSDTGSWSSHSVSPPSNSTLLTGLNAGAGYIVRVRAVSVIGDGAWSEELTLLAPAFSVSLELQGGHCLNQLTLICRHSDILFSPNWIHNGTAESGQVLDTAFPDALYAVQSNTEHKVTISGVGNLRALYGYIIQCAYSIQGNLFKSNAVKYSFISPGPGRFTITSVSIGACNDILKVTYMENEPDCPGYPTERFTVDVDGVQVADLTADAVRSLAINHANISVTLSLPLNQPLPVSAVTLNVTKYNTVPTNRSDGTGNIVTDRVTWGTSAVFALSRSPPGGESQAAVNDGGVLIATTASLVALWVATVTVFGIVLSWQNYKLKQKVSQQRSPSHSSPPTPLHPKGPDSIQLEPNPSYCSVERAHQ